MINSNFIILLLGLIAAFALGMDKKKSIKEGFNTFQLSPRVMPVNAGNMTNLPSQLQNAAIVGRGVTSSLRLGGDMKNQFLTYPSYQANLSPRMNSIGVTPFMRARMPDRANMAEPINPLGYPRETSINRQNAMDYNKMVTKEKYQGYNDAIAMTGYPGPDYKANRSEYNKIAETLPKTEFLESIPVETMETVSPDGQIENVRVVDQLVYSNLKSRLRGQSDPIRGDLPITPCQRGWFSVSVNPVVDLNQGALAVMGGLDNEQTKQTWSLASKYAGGVGQTASSIAGLGFNPIGSGSKMTLQKSLGMSPDEGVSVVQNYGARLTGVSEAHNQTPIIATAFP